MERFIKPKNIEHYRDLPKTFTDPAYRRTIEESLREKKAKLKKLEEDRKKS
jgi:hypothetical protein